MANTRFYTARAALKTDTSALDITIAGETRTPTGAVVICGRATAVNTDTNQMNMSCAVTDFTTTAGIAKNSEHGVNPTDINILHQESKIIDMHDEGANTTLRSATATAITGGIRITCDQSGTAFQVKVILIFGSVCKAFSTLGAAQDSTFTVAHGMGANGAGAGFFFFNQLDVATSGNGYFSVGFHSDKGTIKQGCVAWGESGSVTTTDIDSWNSTLYCAVRVTATGTINRAIELTSQDGTNTTFTARTASSAADKLVGLLVECDDVETDVQSIAAPTSAASDWNFNGLAFQPQFVSMVLTEHDTADQQENSVKAGNMGFFSVDEEGSEHCCGWAIEEGVVLGSTNTQSRMDDQLYLALDDGAVGTRMSNFAFTTDGWDVAAADINNVNGTQVWTMLAIEQAQFGQIINRVLTESVVVTDPQNNYIFSKSRAGDRVELLTDAAFTIFTLGRIVQSNLSLSDQIILKQQLQRDLMDSADIVDFVARVSRRFRETVDSIVMTDKIKKTITIPDIVENFATIQESIDIVDNIDARFVGINSRTNTDSIDILTAEFIERFRSRTAAEQVEAIIDLLSMSHEKIRRDTLKVTDDLIVSRSAILNSAVLQDSISVNDLFESVSGTLLGPDVEIITGIERQ